MQTHREGVSCASLSQAERLKENEGGMETEKERDGEKQGIWRGARWREELQYDERLGEGRGAKSLSIPPYFSLNLNCSAQM